MYSGMMKGQMEKKPVTSAEKNHLMDLISSVTDLFQEDEKIGKDIVAWLQDVSYTAQAPPQEVRPIIVKLGVTKEILFKFWIVMLYRGQRISAYAQKNNPSAVQMKTIMSALNLRDYSKGKTVTAGYTVGKVMACFPEFGCYVAHHRKNSKFQDFEYKGILPPAYQHPSGFSVLPFGSMENDARRAAVVAFMHWQNWYIEVRARAASTVRRAGVIIRTQEDKENARKRIFSFMVLQVNNPWPQEATLALWKKFGSEKVNPDDYFNSDAANHMVANYDPIKDYPPSAENWMPKKPNTPPTAGSFGPSFGQTVSTPVAFVPPYYSTYGSQPYPVPAQYPSGLTPVYMPPTSSSIPQFTPTSVPSKMISQEEYDRLMKATERPTENK